MFLKIYIGTDGDFYSLPDDEFKIEIKNEDEFRYVINSLIDSFKITLEKECSNSEFKREYVKRCINDLTWYRDYFKNENAYVDVNYSNWSLKLEQYVNFLSDEEFVKSLK